MINDLKLGFKLLKHSMQFKMSIIIGCLFMIIGLIFDITSLSMTSPVISVYYLFGMAFTSQLVSNLSASQMVQSSPYKKRLQTTIITMMCVCIELITMTMMLGIKAIQYYGQEDMQICVIDSILIVSMSILVFNLYMTMATKFYWSATVVFFLTYFGLFGIIMRRQYEMAFQGILGELAILPQISFVTAVAICYGAILLGGILMYVISNLLYKREYSKMMFKTALERAK